METCLDLREEGEDVSGVLSFQFMGEFTPQTGPAPETTMFSWERKPCPCRRYSWVFPIYILDNLGSDQKALQRKDSRPWICFGCFWNPPAQLCSAPGNFCSWRDSSYSWPFLPFQTGAAAEFANLSGHFLVLPQQQRHCFCLQAISQAFLGKHHILLSFLFRSLL